jgi:hypothetical protein
VGWWIVAGFVTVIVCGVARLWQDRAQLAKPPNGLMLFMLFNILFVSAVGNLMDIGENNRFRFVIDPFLLVLFIFFLRIGISKLSVWKRRTARMKMNVRLPAS